MVQDPYKYFRLEARELLDWLGSGVVELEKGRSDAVLVQRLLRYAHTLKGAARVVKQNEIAEQTHAIEDALAPLRDSAEPVPQEKIDAILRHLNDIDGRVGTLAPAQSAAVAAVVKDPVAGDKYVPTIRADIGEMDALLDGVAETHLHLNGVRTAAQAVERAQRLADLLLAQLAARGTTDLARPQVGNSGRIHSIAAELRSSFAVLARNLGSAVDQMDRELRQLRAAAEQLRLVSTGTLLAALERTARDAAQLLGKQVVFEATGGSIRLDAHVLSGLQSALVQIVRNAVAHGIEPESDRRAAGKPAAGRVSINVSRRAGRIVFECRDDGRGVDLEAVRRIARQRGLLGAEAERLGAEALVQVLLRGGISTSAAVTEVSGRGIGLDIVRETVERLGGEVAVRIEQGRGTIFEFAVPIALASLDALEVEASGMTVAIPLNAVRGSMRIAANDICTTPNGASVVYESTVIPFIPLPQAVHGTRSQAGRPWSVVVLAGDGGVAAVGVDRLLGTVRTVVRPLPEYAPVGAMAAGVSLDSEGNPQLVLDPDSLVAGAQRGAAVGFEPVSVGPPVLVIDDSITTRMLEQSILESAGYEVDAAMSAEEALERARRKRYALFLVDVDMPGMDGFTFVERIRADPVLNDIPAILVTSRAAPEDRQRGRDVGARGYIVKSEFDQSKLLTMIKVLTG